MIRGAVCLLLAGMFFEGAAAGQSGCEAVGLPLTEDFEGSGELPNCWDRWENFDYMPLKAHVVSSPVSAGLGALMISSGNTAEPTHESMVMARVLSQSPSGIRMRFKVRANAAGAKLIMGVSLSTSNLFNNFDFEGVDTITIATANVWTTVDVDYSGYTGTGDRPTFRMIQGMQPGPSTMIYIDEMTVQRCWVENLWVSHLSDNEMTLHWNSVGNGTANLTVIPQGGGDTLTFNGVDSPYRIQGLTVGTSYLLTLTPQCSGEVQAGNTQSITASTIGGIHNGLTYCEDFETSGMPVGWTASGSVVTVTSYSHSGNRSLYLNNGGHWAVLPLIADGNGVAVSINELMLSMYLNATGTNCRLEVAVTDYPMEESEFTPIDTLTVGVANVWTPQLVKLTYDGTKRFLVFRTWTTSGNGIIYLDDLRVGRCLLTGLTVSEQSSTSATLEWDAPMWNGNIVIEPATDGGTSITIAAGDSVTAGRQHYTLTGLAPGSSHTYTVYGACDPDHCGSETVNLTTYEQEYTIPYCTDFEQSGTTPTDWQTVTGGSTFPQVETSTPHSGSRSLRLAATGGLSSTHTLTLLPPLTAEGTSGVVVSFAVYNGTAGGTLQVGTLSMPAWESNFTSAVTLTPTAGQWTRVTVHLPGFTGNGERIALRYYHNGYNERSLWIDDLEVSRSGVSDLYAYGERSDGATLAWTSTGGTVDIQYRKGTAGIPVTVTGAVSPLVLNDLDEGSTYHYYVRCTTDSVEGCWMYGGSFTTNSGALIADYCHPTSFTVGGSTPWTLPYLEEATFNGLRVSFDAVGNGAVLVGLMANPTAVSTFTQLGQTYGGSTEAPIHYSVNLTGHESEGHYVALRSNGGTLTIHNLRISRGGIINISAPEVTAETALLSWNAEGAIDSLHLTVVQGMTTVMDTTFVAGTSTFLLTGLMPGTTYNYSLTAINNLSSRSCGDSEGLFVTLESDVEEWWCEDFEGTPTSTLPAGWSSISNQSGDPAVYYQSGTRWLRMTSTPTDDALVAMPSATTSLAGLVLRFDAYASGNLPEQSILVGGIMSDRYNLSSFTALDTFHITEAQNTYLLDLSAYGGTGHIIALRYLSPNYTRTLYIDNLSLARQQIARLHVDQETDHSLRLSWSGSDTVRVTGSGIDTLVTGSHSVTFDGLTAGTAYTFQVTAGGTAPPDDCHLHTITGHTLAESMNTPLCLGLDDYNNATSLPYGWTRPYGSQPVSQTSTRYDGSRALRFYSQGSPVFVVSPMLEDSLLSGLYLSFYLLGGGTYGQLDVGVMSDPADTSTFTLLASYTNAASWTRCELSLAGAPNGAKYIAFRYHSTSGNYLYLDKVMIQSCPMPVVSITNPRHNTMEVHWSGATSPVWIEYGTSSSNMTRLLVPYDSSNAQSYTLTGLNPNTDYTIHLWPQCSDDDFECHKLTLSQRTLPLPQELTYCQSFIYSSLPDGWRQMGDGTVTTSTNTPDGDRALLLYAPMSGNATAIFPGLTTAEGCTPPENVYLVFQRVLTSGSGTLQLGVVDDVLDTNSFSPICSISFGGASWSWQDTVIALPTSLLSDFLALRLIPDPGNSATVCIDDLCLRYCLLRNITIDGTTPSSTTFCWENFGAEQITISWNSPDGGGSGSAVTDTCPFTVTGFTPNATYNFTFIGQCPCNQSVTYSFGSGGTRFPADTMIVPLCYTFENFSSGSFPLPWRRMGGYYSNYPQVISNTDGHYLDFYTNSWNPQYLILEPLHHLRDTIVFSGTLFCSNIETVQGTFEVGLVSHPGVPTSFIPVDTVVIEALDTWQSFHVLIPGAAGRHPALRFTPAGTSHLYVDNISISPCAPAALHVTDDTLLVSTLGNTATLLLGITNLQQQTSRQLTITPAVPAIPFSSIPLSTDSVYQVTLNTLCSDSISMLCENQALTIGYRLSLPYCETFEGKNLHPEGWEVIQRSGPTYPRCENQNNNNRRYHLQPTATSPNLVVLPLLPINVTAGGLHIWVDVTLGSNSDIGLSLVEIGVYANGEFTPLATMQNARLSQNHNLTLPSSAGTRLALRASCTSGTRNIYLDNLKVTTYSLPDSLLYTHTGCRRQHIYWHNTTGNSHYLAEWGLQNFSPGTGTMLLSDSCHLLLQPLQPSTTYQLYLYNPDSTTLCYSYLFTSLPAPIGIPWCDNSNHNLASGTLHYLPEVETPVDSLTLRLRWRTPSSGRLVIGVLTDRYEPSSFTPIDTLFPEANNQWDTSYVNLYDYADTGVFIALRFEGASGQVQQISLQQAPQPSFHVLNSSSVEVTTIQNPVDYYLRVVPSGSGSSSGTLHHVTTSPYIVTGLQPYTQYNFYTQADANTACTPPVTHRTHLDIEIPYCTNLATQPAGWYFDGRYRVMPYPLIDSLAHTHLYFNSQGRVTVGVMSALDDTNSFIPLNTFENSTITEQILHLNQYASQIDSLHYLAFRYENNASAVTSVSLRTVARAVLRVLSSSDVEVTVPDGQESECYIRVCTAGAAQSTGTTYHLTTSPFIITGLSMYTLYDFYTLGNADETACDDPITLRTHLNVEAPYCVTLSNESTGWYIVDNYRVMPYLNIDTMTRVWVTLRSRGNIEVGTTGFLTDTAAFTSLVSYSDFDWTTHTLSLASYATLIGDDHYLAFRGGQLQSVTLRTCTMPVATLTAFNEICFTQAGEQHDYWINYNGGQEHVTQSPYYLHDLSQNTWYQFSFSCGSADAECLVDTAILTGVQIATPHCSELSNYRFGSGILPAGWFTRENNGDYYAIMPIVNLDSLHRLFLRLQYRITQNGAALEAGVIDWNPYSDTSSTFSFTPMATFGASGTEWNDVVIPFGNYSGGGKYVAFRATGSGLQNVLLNKVELQTIPFVNYLLTDYHTVSVVPWNGNAYLNPSFIEYGNQIVRADSLPWTVTGLAEDATYSFNLRADSANAPCIDPTVVHTTHQQGTPACGLSATLSSASPIWRGPELTTPDIASLQLRTHLISNNAGNRVVIGLLRIHNVDSTFTPLDTLLAGSTAEVVLTASLAQAQANDGRFLAMKLLPASSNANVQCTDIFINHCLPPLTAHLTLLRHNIVAFSCDSAETIDGLWLDYGLGAIPITSHEMVFSLANNTTYQFFIKCDSAEIPCSTPLSITTLAPPPTLSWCEGFDSSPTGALPTNWQAAAPLINTQNISIVSNNSHTASRSLYMNSTLGHGNIAVLPDMGLDSLRSLTLSLWLYTDLIGSHIEVGTIVDPSDPETFTPLKNLVLDETVHWKRFLVDMTDAPMETYFIGLRCDGNSGPNRVWIDDLHLSECGSNSAILTSVDAAQVTLRWRQTGSPSVSIDVLPAQGTGWTVYPETIEWFGEREYSVTGLTPLTNYQFVFHSSCDDDGAGFCTNAYHDTVSLFTPAGSATCVDPTNFHADYTSCFYGSYGNPTAHEGFVDYGYLSPLSRHTVHYDISETDARTGNQLHTVPDGATASVRLGNWTYNATAPEAEQIVYGISVDTLEYDLLILRYAAVLQDPRHAASEQPRFSLELLDEGMQLIDPLCGRADFIANYQMGWNIAPGNDGILWKDWTTVGIDLTPYAGRTIYVRLTTRDCGEGSHFGYAYFTLDCMRKNITTSRCGIVAENELTAPSGFNYRWYTSTDTSTLSTNQTIVVPTNNNVYYFCNLSFVDNPSCSFTMNAFAGTRYPLSLFDYTVSLATCRMDVNFTNRSTISMDGVTPVGTGESVETAYWNFGNGDSATTYHANTSYYQNGTYDVQLVTGIAGNECLDTLIVPVTILFPETEMEITGPTSRCINAPADTLELHNVVRLLSSNTDWEPVDSAIVGNHMLKHYRKVVAPAAVGTYNYTATALDSIGCTVSLNHTLAVHPAYSFHDTRHLCSLLFPYSWRDTVLALPAGEYTMEHSDLTLHRYSQHGCDSIMTLDLNIYNNTHYTPRDTAYGAVCDNLSFFFSDSLLVPNASTTHNVGPTTIFYTDSLYSSIGCDSLSTIVLSVHPTYDHHLHDTVCSNQSYIWGSPQREMFSPHSTTTHTRPSAPDAVTAAIDSSWTDNLLSVHNCDSLSSLHLHISPSYHLHHYDTICDAHLLPDTTWQHHTYTYENTTFDSTVVFISSLSTFNSSCDSVRTLHLKVWPTYHLHFFDTIYDGDLYSFENSVYDTTGVYNALLASTPFLCDSLRTLHLQRNRRTYIDSVICQNELPLTWVGGAFFAEGGGLRTSHMQVFTDSVHLSGFFGIDSLVVMTLIVRDTSTTVDIVHTCDSLTWEHTPDTIYRASTVEPYHRMVQLSEFDTAGLSHLTSHVTPSNPRLLPFTLHLAPYSVQCDSVRHLNLKVDHTHYATDYRVACDSLRWPDNVSSLTSSRYHYRDTIGFAGPLGSFFITGPVDTMVTVGGCDSVVNLDLAVFYATYEESIDTFCFGETYNWHRFTVGVPLPDSIIDTYLSDTLHTHIFHHPRMSRLALTCDSVEAIRLTQMARPWIMLHDSADCAHTQYDLEASTDVAYTRWSSEPHDPSLNGQEYQLKVAVSPTQITHYYLYADYHSERLCPYRDTLTLVPIVIPEAKMQVNPKGLTWQQLYFDAYDQTSEAPSHIHPDDELVWQRHWFVDWQEMAEQGRQLHYDVRNEEVQGIDSLAVALRLFNGQCYDTATLQIPMLLVSVFAPNIFTPLESTNNRFTIVTRGILDTELYIYNREGILIYHTTDISEGWDGRRQDGAMSPQGSYVWKLDYHAIDHPESPRSEVGTVTLIK